MSNPTGNALRALMLHEAGVHTYKHRHTFEAAKVPALDDVVSQMAFNEWLGLAAKRVQWTPDGCNVGTFMGRRFAHVGDYMMKYEDGTLYCMRPDLFEQDYMRIDK